MCFRGISILVTALCLFFLKLSCNASGSSGPGKQQSLGQSDAECFHLLHFTSVGFKVDEIEWVVFSQFAPRLLCVPWGSLLRKECPRKGKGGLRFPFFMDC